MLKKEELKTLDGLDIIYQTITGSTARGLNTETSDIDVKGIFVPNKANLFHLSPPKETICQHDPDTEYHHLRKFLELAALKANPTILEMLFTNDEFIQVKAPIMDVVIAERDRFLTKQVYQSFASYARGQLMRIKNAKLDVLPAENETHLAYVLGGIIENAKRMNHYATLGENDFPNIENVVFTEKGLEEVRLSGQYDRVKLSELYGLLSELRNATNSYQTLGNRNNKANEARLYKHAGHLVLLLRMGTEVLQGKGLQVYRTTDREEILGIRKGRYTFAEIYQYADELFKELDSAYKHSQLPDKCDTAVIHDLYNRTLQQYYKI